jgi:hypothetical protein
MGRRPFAPFVAGVTRTRRDRLTFFDVSGGARCVVNPMTVLIAPGGR